MTLTWRNTISDMHDECLDQKSRRKIWHQLLSEDCNINPRSFKVTNIKVVEPDLARIEVKGCKKAIISLLETWDEDHWVNLNGTRMSVNKALFIIDKHFGTEELIYIQQERLIKRKCGKRASMVANYGWGVTGDRNYVSVATKVYRHGILQSDAFAPKWEIKHKWVEKWN